MSRASWPRISSSSRTPAPERWTGSAWRCGSGEILGIAGVDGNGQTELADALAGVSHAESGRVYLDGEDVTALGADPRQERGLAYVPEDRASKGLVQDFMLYENNSLKTYDEPPILQVRLDLPERHAPPRRGKPQGIRRQAPRPGRAGRVRSPVVTSRRPSSPASSPATRT